MSYDVIAKCPCGCPNCTFRYVDWNYTSNMAPAWREAGLDLAEFDGKTCRELASAIDRALGVMVSHRDEYAARFDAPNGWGSMKSLLHALLDLHLECSFCPEAVVEVSR